MNSKISAFIRSPLFYGGTIMIIGGGVANVFAYLYHLIFGRVTGPSQYGELTSILSFWGIFLALFSSVGMVIMKFVAGKDKKEIAKIYSWINRKLLIYIFALSFGVALCSPIIADLLHINFNIALLISPIIFFSVLPFLYGAILQGILKFGQATTINAISVLLRLIFGLIFFYLGLKIFGIVLGLLFASILSFLIAKYYISNLHLPTASSSPDFKEIMKYSLPVVITAISLSSLFSTDMVLAKHYFDPHTAGIYGSVSVLGKMIFYSISPLAGVMFPIAAGKKNNGEKTLSTFVLSILFALILSLSILSVFIFLPNLIVGTLFGREFMEGAKYLALFGVFSVSYTLTTLLVSYLLSLGLTISAYFVAIAAVFQVIAIIIFHSTIYEIISVNILISVILFTILVVYSTIKYQKILFLKLHK